MRKYHHTTGDGILAALRLIEAMKEEDKPLSELSKIMKVFPQILINVEVERKPDLNNVPVIKDAIKSVETSLGKKGRVLVRYSGTQSICRIMVEGPTIDETIDKELEPPGTDFKVECGKRIIRIQPAACIEGDILGNPHGVDA